MNRWRAGRRARAPRRLPAFVLAAGLLPLTLLALRAATDRLGANPVEEITHTTGSWALRLLLASLTVTPLRRWLRWPVLAPCRRTLGLLAFLYASLHFATYLALDLGGRAGLLLEDVVKRPYVTAGFGAWLLLVPLALTSTRAMQRRLGRRWVALHRLAYLAVGAALTHFLWLAKADLREPLVYVALAAAILGARLGPRR